MTNLTPGDQRPVKLFGRTYTFSTQAILLILLATAIVLRVAVSFFHGNTVGVLPGIYDQVSYDSLARRVLSGHGFTFAEPHWPLTRAGEPTAHWSFLYTFFLTGVYALFGPNPLTARLIQAFIVGGLQTFLVYRIGEKAFSQSVGLVAAAITVFYIYFIYYSGALMTEPFYITAILGSLFIAMRIAENPGRQRDIRLGIALGIILSIIILLRQVFLLFLPFLFLWIWLARNKRGLNMPIVPTLLSLFLIFLSILPVTLYNYSRFGRFVLLNTNSGYAFFWGNHPVYGTRFIPILPREMGSYQSLVPANVRHLDEVALDQELLRQGLQFVIDDPGRYLLLSLSRIPAYFMFWPSSDSSLISNISRVASFGITLPFIVYGLLLVIKNTWAKKGNIIFNLFSSFEGLLILFALIYTGIHVLTWALIRYRLPVDAVLIPFAALALCRLFNLKPVAARMGGQDPALMRK